METAMIDRFALENLVKAFRETREEQLHSKARHDNRSTVPHSRLNKNTLDIVETENNDKRMLLLSSRSQDLLERQKLII